jgi:glycosyltransferase involved in cell wall biosynthesis
VKTLYICYFGLREPLVQTQVLPYLRQLSAGGIKVSLLTFDSSELSQKEREGWRNQLSRQGIRWFSLKYHKRPSLPATLYDIVAGTLLASRLVRREGIEVVHARSHVPAAMAALTKKISACRMVFDIRGFFPEEYVDAGLWPAGGLLYRLTKRAEKRLLGSSDACVVLTKRAREIVRSSPALPASVPVEVIPCCVDLQRFAGANGCREQMRKQLGVEARRVIVYVGAMGGWYLSEEMADFLALAHELDQSTFALILTQSSLSEVAGRLSRRGMSDSDFLVVTVAPGQVPHYLAAADLAFCFIKPSYSKVSSSPTKIAEYLASGLPVVCNAGIGDVDEVLSGDRVGVMVRDFSPEAYAQAICDAEALRSEPGIAERCRASARAHFDLLSVGGPRYRSVYEALAMPPHRNGSRPR